MTAMGQPSHGTGLPLLEEGQSLAAEVDDEEEADAFDLGDLI